MSSIQEQARAIIAAKKAEEAAVAVAAASAAALVATERERREADARVIAAAERQQALLRAERLEAEQAAANTAAAEKAAVAAEVARLLARTPIEILQDEMAEMKRQLASPPPPQLHLRADGELDMRFKSSKEELATARGEIAELKKLMTSILSGGFFIRNKRSGMMLDHDTSGRDGGKIIHAWDHNGQTNQIWTLERA